jgi:transcriptional regulator with XRE-family HTH domain
MGIAAHDPTERGAALSRALKTIRRQRGLGRVEVARAMGMPLRSYDYFESGRGRLNVDRVHQVAEILNADPYAFLAAIEIGSPEFAIRCADNKLMVVLTMALQEFDARASDEIPRLDPRTLFAAFTAMFDDLTRQARDRDAVLTDWMSDRTASAAPSELHKPED